MQKLRTTALDLPPSLLSRSANSPAVVSMVQRTGLGYEGVRRSWTCTEPRWRSARTHSRSAGCSCMFCRCFSSVFLSRLRVCDGPADAAAGIRAPRAAVTAAAAERFLFERLRLNRRELESLDEPRPSDAAARFDALEVAHRGAPLPLFASAREGAERPPPPGFFINLVAPFSACALSIRAADEQRPTLNQQRCALGCTSSLYI